MQYKQLGRSGLRVSSLAYGPYATFGNQLNLKEAKVVLQCCRDHGVNFFDNAETYLDGEAEEMMGRAFRELGWKRSDLVVSTKIFNGGTGPNDKGLSRKHIVEGTKASLKRLEMDYVDLIYCNNPDNTIPMEEIVRAKVEREFLPLYSNFGLGLTTYGPLMEGVLTGKYIAGKKPPGSRFTLEKYKVHEKHALAKDGLKMAQKLKPIADELGVPLSQLAIAWCASNPNVSSVITGASKKSQVEENMKAIDIIPLLTPKVMEKIEAIVQSKPKLRPSL